MACHFSYALISTILLSFVHPSLPSSIPPNATPHQTQTMAAQPSHPSFPFTPHAQWAEPASALLPFLPPAHVDVVGSFMLGTLSKPVRDGGREGRREERWRESDILYVFWLSLSLTPSFPPSLLPSLPPSLPPQAPTVDVAMEIPSSTFGPRWPWLNYRYHNRRNAYLARVKEGLEHLDFIR